MNLSKHFKISCAVILAASLALVFVYRRIAQRVTTVFPGLTKPVAVLPKADKERIAINEKTHTLTVQTAKQTIVEYAKNPVVEIKKDGSVNVTRHLTGFENEPFIGFGYSDTGRIFIGDNLYHFGRFDGFGSIAWTPVNSVVAFKAYIGVGYNFYHNTSANLAMDPGIAITRTPDIAGFVSVRF